MWVRLTDQIVVDPSTVESIVLWKYMHKDVPGSFIRLSFVSGKYIDLRDSNLTLEDVLRSLGGHGQLEVACTGEGDAT